jgi:propanol-preferring alcohol dehydrogenase
MMHAMELRAIREPLWASERPDPRPEAHQLLIRVPASGVCRTDLHLVDGELADPNLPIVPGHEIVGRVLEAGPGVTRLKPGDRVASPCLPTRPWPSCARAICRVRRC